MNPAPEAPAETIPAERGRWLLALAGQFVFVFSAVALTGPGRIDIVDGQMRYEVARSLGEHGDSAIRDRYAWFRVHTGRDGLKHTPYRFPQSGLGVAAIHLADSTGEASEPRRHFFFVLTSAFCAAVLALTYSVWFHGLGLGRGAALLWATAGIFCTPNWFYSTSTFDDILGASAVVLAVAAAYLGRERWPLLGAGLAGLMLGWAVNCKEPLALFVLPVLAHIWRRDLPTARRLVPAALVLVGLTLGVATYKAYDLYKFPPGSADHNEEYQIEYGAMWTADPSPGLAGFAFSTSSGVFWYCPTLLLSLAGWTVWRRTQREFCNAVVVASLLFVLFLSFLTFFKGEPCWGPRYLTPLFALWWVFVPASVERVRPLLLGLALTSGLVVQLLGLSVDPQRLFLEKTLPFNYYIYDPWLQFHPEASHLFQRPGEIRRILTATQQAPQYTPAHLPTYATRIPPVLPVSLSHAMGQLAAPLPLKPFAATSGMLLTGAGHGVNEFRAAVHRYHVFASFRPWWVSQQYLAPEERPIDIKRTLQLLLGAALFGVALMVVGSHVRRRMS
ncbi:MAG: hypothetical protein L0Z62_41105 [Gemmataceae bacterium]|nr:hypothetical protein [Gemmataceae bacterium]